jgi:hypothetical protein
MNIHKFGSTGEAYDSSQTGYYKADEIHPYNFEKMEYIEVKDGDILVVESEKVVGIMVEAWPVAVTQERGEFHTLDPDITWADFDNGKYYESYLHAHYLSVTGKD